MDEQFNVEDSIQLKTVKKRKTALILRVGGLGDCAILTPIAKELNKRGYDVDFFCGSPTGNIYLFFDGLSYFRSVKQVHRLNNIDCIKDGDDFISVEILKKRYDEVFDYKFSVEDNRAGVNSTEGWRNTINSNYMNWIDLSFAWANIDYTKLKDEEKRPEITFPRTGLNGEKSKYFIWLESTPIEPLIDDSWLGKKRNYKIIGINLQASSLIRSWYKAYELPDIIHAKYPDDMVLVFQNNIWLAITKYGRQAIQFDGDLDPLISSAYIVREMDCIISADSGFSHIAEALGIQNITIYTTVPSWTRSKYYKYSHPIDANVWCSPCFTLDFFCPIEKRKAYDSLSEREKEILKAGDIDSDPREIAKKYSTLPAGIVREYEAAKKRVEALSATEPACVKSITTEQILSKLDLILKKEKYVDITS